MAIAFPAPTPSSAARVNAPKRVFYKTKAEWAQSEADKIAAELSTLESRLREPAVRADWRRRKGLEQYAARLNEDRSNWVRRANYFKDRGL